MSNDALRRSCVFSLASQHLVVHERLCLVLLEAVKVEHEAVERSTRACIRQNSALATISIRTLSGTRTYVKQKGQCARAFSDSFMNRMDAQSCATSRLIAWPQGLKTCVGHALHIVSSKQ